MKKMISMILVLATLFCVMAIPHFAAAENACGSTSKKVVLKVDVSSYNGYIVLSSSTGLARVAQHNWRGIYSGDGNEKTHGFYSIILGNNEVYDWVPSATTNTKDAVTCREFQLGFKKPGTYYVAIYPMDNNTSARFWRMDWIQKWVYDATWMVTITSGCTVSVQAVQNANN